MTITTDHRHELCTEVHIGQGAWAASHRWTEPHCVECGEPMPDVPEHNHGEYASTSPDECPGCNDAEGRL